MTDDMGTFRTDIELENPEHPGDRRRVEALLVDTGSELTWVPAPILESMGIARVKRLSFRQATGQVVERWAGGARIFAAGTQSLDDVVFAEPGDLGLLGVSTRGLHSAAPTIPTAIPSEVTAAIIAPARIGSAMRRAIELRVPIARRRAAPSLSRLAVLT